MYLKNENDLLGLPNIGKTLAEKLVGVGICSAMELKTLGSKNALLKIASIENNGACLNMLYALEGAIQCIRWHGLSVEYKKELKEFYNKSVRNNFRLI